jgi:DNA-binding SARP family transcriptional activator
LYRGDYLMSLKADWVVNRRESLQQAACDTLIALGRICESEGNPREALGHYVRASHLKPEREDSAYAAMRLYRELDMPQDGLKTYQRLASTLRERLNVAPSSQLQQLAEQLGS